MPIDPLTAIGAANAVIGGSGDGGILGTLTDNPILSQLGLSAAGVVGQELLGEPELPDLEGQTQEVFERRRALLNRRLQKQAQTTQDSIAAQGLTGTAAANQRAAQIEEANRAAEQQNAEESAALQNARTREEQLRFRRDRNRFRNRSQGIFGLVGGLGDFIQTRSLLQNQDLTNNQNQ